MKEKVLKVLKPTFAKYGFNAQELEGFAEAVAANLTPESTDEEINNAISGVEIFASIAQKAMNRGVSATEAKYKGWIKPDPQPQPQPKPQPEDIEAMVKARVDAMMQPFVAERQKEKLNERLVSDSRLASIPRSYLRHYSIESEDQLDSMVETISSDYASLMSEQIKSGQVVEAPKGSGGDPSGVASDEDVKAIAELFS